MKKEMSKPLDDFLKAAQDARGKLSKSSQGLAAAVTENLQKEYDAVTKPETEFARSQQY